MWYQIERVAVWNKVFKVRIDLDLKGGYRKCLTSLYERGWHMNCTGWSHVKVVKLFNRPGRILAPTLFRNEGPFDTLCWPGNFEVEVEKVLSITLLLKLEVGDSVDAYQTNHTLIFLKYGWRRPFTKQILFLKYFLKRGFYRWFMVSCPQTRLWSLRLSVVYNSLLTPMYFLKNVGLSLFVIRLRCWFITNVVGLPWFTNAHHVSQKRLLR